MWFLKEKSGLIPKDYNRLKIYRLQIIWPPKRELWECLRTMDTRFFSKIKPLVQNTSFPLSNEALSAFFQLKNGIELSVVCAVDETAPFQVETDASEFALTATLSQKNRPVAFFSRTLSKTEQKHSAVKKRLLLLLRQCVSGSVTLRVNILL